MTKNCWNKVPLLGLALIAMGKNVSLHIYYWDCIVSWKIWSFGAVASLVVTNMALILVKVVCGHPC